MDECSAFVVVKICVPPSSQFLRKKEAQLPVLVKRTTVIGVTSHGS